MNIASSAMFIGGGVLAATGIILLLASPEEDVATQGEKSSFTPDLRVGPGAVQIGGTFSF